VLLVIGFPSELKLAVLMQEQPLEMREGRPEHAVAQEGNVTDVMALVYAEQNGVASVDERIMARYDVILT
jgi:hypothetical protein